MAFHELLFAIVDKSDIEAELNKTSAARAHGIFLLDAPLKLYLEDLYNQAFKINATGQLLHNPSAWASREAHVSAAAQHGGDKLRFASRLDELANKFKRYLCLEDFAHSNFLVPWKRRSNNRATA
jgi:hypothetical protein